MLPNEGRRLVSGIVLFSLPQTLPKARKRVVSKKKAARKKR